MRQFTSAPFLFVVVVVVVVVLVVVTSPLWFCFAFKVLRVPDPISELRIACLRQHPSGHYSR